jgi:hypothetical protein
LRFEFWFGVFGLDFWSFRLRLLGLPFGFGTWI